MSRSELDSMISAATTNPMAVQRAGIEYLERVSNGEVEIVDPSNAFVYLMEFASTLFTNQRRKDELINMRQYPELANSRKDLYHHMSDIDYLDVFSKPAEASLMLIMDLEEIKSKAIDTGINGIRKLVIPRYTKIKAGDINFLLQYPIEIRVLSYGGIQVVYDNRLISPLQSLESNQINWVINNYNSDRTEFINLDIPLQQLDMKTYTAPMSAAKTFSKTYSYSDLYHYCRVYMKNGDGTWTEMKTTHSDLVYNPSTPTAVLSVLEDNKLNVSIPQVYFSTGLANRTIRVDIFTTKGPLELAINEYAVEMFSVEFNTIDNDDHGVYTEPTPKLNTVVALGSSKVSGGSSSLGFAKLKERVIFNSLTNVELPITNVQLKSQLDRITDMGFSIETDIDNVTNRLIAVSREMPIPEIREISTGMGSNVVTLSRSVNHILANADVVDNGPRITVLPSTLYRDEGGYLSIIPSEERDSILSMPPDLLTTTVNNNQYFYTPFHYVYDLTDNVFRVRPYYFGDPTITRKYFVGDNGVLGVGITTNTHSVVRDGDEWVIQVMTGSTDNLKELDDEAVMAQLAFIPQGEIGRVYLNGSLLGRDPVSKEWIFEFRFGTTWDIDKNHRLHVVGFESEGVAPHSYPTSLDTVFDIFYVVRESDLDYVETSDIDALVGDFLINESVIGMYHEQLTIGLGSSLEGLWSRARSTIGEEHYLRHTVDVPKLWETNVPEYDPVTGAVVLEYDEENRPSIVYAHMAGDPVMDNGEPVYVARAGDLVYVNGAPVVSEPRNILRQVEMVLFDGAYYFVTNATDATYKVEVPEQVVTWVNQTLKPVREKLLENTTLWFHPKSNVGMVPVVSDEGLQVTIQAAQRLLVEIYVPTSVYRDDALKSEIRRTVREVVSNQLKTVRVQRSTIINALRENIGDEVVEVAVRNLGGSADYDVVTMVDESARLCIGKKLTQLPDGTYGVEDAIDIMFTQHGE